MPKKRKLQGQASNCNTCPRVFPQQGFPQRNQRPPSQWSQGQYPQCNQNQNQQCPQYQQQYGNQRPQQQANPQVPCLGVPNNVPVKNVMTNNPNACYCYGEVGHYAHQCPKKHNPLALLNQNNNQRPNARPPHTGRVNHVSTNSAQEAPEVILGTFSINSIPATVLFDSGALHSFISQAFVRVHSIALCTMKNSMLVNSPGGTMPANYCSPSTSISLRGGRVQSKPHCAKNFWY